MKKLTCIVCPKGCDLEIEMKNDEYLVNGNMCNRGKLYAINEMTNPMRSITTTIKTTFKTAPRLPVRTDKEIEVKTIYLSYKAAIRQIDPFPVRFNPYIQRHRHLISCLNKPVSPLS